MRSRIAVLALGLALSGAFGEDSSSSADSGSAGHEHSTYVLTFPILCLLIGVAMQSLLNRFAPSVPYTPCLLVIGIGIALIDEYLPNTWSHVAESVDVWYNMDGHLLLYVFLPPLVFADAMFLKWHTLRKCIGQCALLGLPGVVLGTCLFALFARYILPQGWEGGNITIYSAGWEGGEEGEGAWTWDLCIAFGAVMSATDPVAVVSILNGLGAPPALTMIIGGESLLNDGSAIVLYSVAFEIWRGREVDPEDGITSPEDGIKKSCILLFLSPILGFVFGAVWRFILGKFESNLDHTNGLMQTVLTYVGAYACFYVAEAVVGASGVLAAVVMGMTLSATFWPVLADPNLLIGTWHTIEWVYNTILFQLAGLIIGHQIAASDKNSIANSELAEQSLTGQLYGIVDGTTFGWGVVCYLFALIIRSIVIFCCFPLLQRMGYGLSWQGAIVASWGGLRGAVGLALALVMRSELLDQVGFEKAASRIVIYVSMTAILTLVINAPLTGPLVRRLGLTAVPRVEKKALEQVKSRIGRHAISQFKKIRVDFDWEHNAEAEQWKQWVVGKVSTLSGGHGGHGSTHDGKRGSRPHLSDVAVAKSEESVLEGSPQPEKGRPCSPAQKLADSKEEKRKRSLRKSSTSPALLRGADEELAKERRRSSIAPTSAAGILASTARSSVARAVRRRTVRGSTNSPDGKQSSREGRGKENLRMLANKVTTSIHMMDHRERISFVRSMFCRHLKLVYDALVRTELLGHPKLALHLRHSVDAAKDMVERQAGGGVTDECMRLADLSIILKQTHVHPLLMYIARNPKSCVASLLMRFPRKMRQWVRLSVVSQLTAVTAYLTAHDNAQHSTRKVLEVGGPMDHDWTSEVNIVVKESETSERMAYEYLEQLLELELGDEPLSQLQAGLKARRTALELLSRLSKKVHEMEEEGALTDKEASALMHELEHDSIHLRATKAPTLDGTGGKSLGGLGIDCLCKFLLPFSELHDKTLEKLIELGYGEVKAPLFSLSKVAVHELHDAEHLKEVVANASHLPNGGNPEARSHDAAAMEAKAVNAPVNTNVGTPSASVSTTEGTQSARPTERATPESVATTQESVATTQESVTTADGTPSAASAAEAVATTQESV